MAWHGMASRAEPGRAGLAGSAPLPCFLAPRTARPRSTSARPGPGSLALVVCGHRWAKGSHGHMRVLLRLPWTLATCSAAGLCGAIFCLVRPSRRPRDHGEREGESGKSIAASARRRAWVAPLASNQPRAAPPAFHRAKAVASLEESKAKQFCTAARPRQAGWLLSGRAPAIGRALPLYARLCAPFGRDARSCARDTLRLRANHCLFRRQRTWGRAS